MFKLTEHHFYIQAIKRLFLAQTKRDDLFLGYSKKKISKSERKEKYREEGGYQEEGGYKEYDTSLSKHRDIRIS